MHRNLSRHQMICNPVEPLGGGHWLCTWLCAAQRRARWSAQGFPVLHIPQRQGLAYNNLELTLGKPATMATREKQSQKGSPCRRVASTRFPVDSCLFTAQADIFHPSRASGPDLISSRSACSEGLGDTQAEGDEVDETPSEEVSVPL